MRRTLLSKEPCEHGARASRTPTLDSSSSGSLLPVADVDSSIVRNPEVTCPSDAVEVNHEVVCSPDFELLSVSLLEEWPCLVDEAGTEESSAELSSEADPAEDDSSSVRSLEDSLEDFELEVAETELDDERADVVLLSLDELDSELGVSDSVQSA